MAQDYYAILGVPQDAGQDEIKSAFRRLARKYHPDVNKDDPEAEAKFKQLGEAYSVLSNDAKRRGLQRHRRDFRDVLRRGRDSPRRPEGRARP